MLDVILWILVNFGITNGIVVSNLVLPFRQWVLVKFKTKLFLCPMCLGFWVGLVLSLSWFSPTGFFLFDMFLGSITSWMLYLLIYKRQDAH